MNIAITPNVTQIKQSNCKPSSPAFTGVWDKATSKLAQGITDGIFSGGKFTKFIENNKQNKTLMTHLTVLGATIISTFYIQKTLKNKKLEKDKRTTLAVNQSMVWALSTVMTYTLDNLINKKIDKLTDHFKELNKSIPAGKVGKYVDGIRTFKSMFVAGMIYRYISPVLVTPLANAVGERIQQNKAKEKTEGLNKTA